MNCHKVQTYLSEYLDGELDTERAGSLERHLEHCPACAAEWHSLRATVRLIGHMGRQECPVDLRASVLQAVTASPARRTRPSLFQRALAVSLGGSAILACLTLPVVLQRATLEGAGLPGMLAQPYQPTPAPVHTEYDMATVLGPTDGLLLAIPARGQAAQGTNVRNDAQ